MFSGFIAKLKFLDYEFMQGQNNRHTAICSVLFFMDLTFTVKVKQFILELLADLNDRWSHDNSKQDRQEEYDHRYC